MALPGQARRLRLKVIVIGAQSILRAEEAANLREASRRSIDPDRCLELVKKSAEVRSTVASRNEGCTAELQRCVAAVARTEDVHALETSPARRGAVPMVLRRAEASHAPENGAGRRRRATRTPSCIPNLFTRRRGAASNKLPPRHGSRMILSLSPSPSVRALDTRCTTSTRDGARGTSLSASRPSPRSRQPGGIQMKGALSRVTSQAKLQGGKAKVGLPTRGSGVGLADPQDEADKVRKRELGCRGARAVAGF